MNEDCDRPYGNQANERCHVHKEPDERNVVPEQTFVALMWHDLPGSRTTAKGGNVRFAERKSDGSDGTRTRDLRRDRPVVVLPA